jgi:hypothetical protein
MPIIKKYGNIPSPSDDNSLSGVFTLPTNAESLSDIELETYLLQFGGWRSWITSQLAVLSSEILVVEETFDLQLGAGMAKFEIESKKKILKESLRSKTIEESAELRDLWNQLLGLRSEKEFLQKKFDLFNGLFEMISRIVSRRASDRYK